MDKWAAAITRQQKPSQPANRSITIVGLDYMLDYTIIVKPLHIRILSSALPGIIYL
jgi:hypothetical protein